MIHALTVGLLLVDVQSSAQEFLTRYRAREHAIQTAVVQSTWNDSKDGKPSRRDRQTIYLDHLGRRRLILSSEQPGKNASWIPHESVPYEWDQLYDGELTASMTFDPRVDRMGLPPKDNKPSGYRAAQIFDGEKDIKHQRTPLGFADGIVTKLESALKNNQVIEVTSETDSQIAFRFPDDKDGQFWTFVVDKTSDWVPTTVAWVNHSGKALMRSEFEYARTATGFWYPKRVFHRVFGNKSEDSVPLRETQFEVTECRINEPEFDEDVFKIKLHPDTAIWDSRYDVNYRIGAENAFTSQLEALAKAALAAQQAAEKGLTGMRPSPRGGTGSRALILIGINLAVVVLIVAGLGYRRWKRA